MPNASSSRAKVFPFAAAAIALALVGVDGLLGDAGSDCHITRTLSYILTSPTKKHQNFKFI